MVNSAKQAIAVGQAIGHKVIVMGTSTGGTLGLYLASGNPSIEGLILYAPNIDLLNQQTRMLTYPWGLQIAKAMFGETYSYDNSDNPGRQFWTNTYQLEAIQGLRLLLDETMTETTFRNITQPVFAGYYYKSEDEKDNSISIPALLDMMELLATPPNQKRSVAFPEADAHVICCEYVSKSVNEVRSETFEFAEITLGLEPKMIHLNGDTTIAYHVNKAQ
jgi:pimeloyl-ACP methyl ester carboxylesterase